MEDACNQTAKEAVLIFGGRGITKIRVNGHVSIFFALTATVDDGGKHRAMFSSIWEEVLFCGCLQLLYGHVTAEAMLGDLGVRQALKDMPNNVRL